MTLILIIEDAAIIREELADALTFEDFEVIVAGDGGEGIALARQHLPDLIICDILMPVLNGYEVLRELKANPETADTPVVFLTSLNDPANIQQGLSMGASAYLVKPFRLDGLMKTVKEVLHA